MMRRTEHGAAAFQQVARSIAIYPPARDVPGRVQGTEDLIKLCSAKGVELSQFAQHWVFDGRPCPTVRANFAYNKRRFVVELV
eukprot:6213279-Prymnesium_polylepis.1